MSLPILNAGVPVLLDLPAATEEEVIRSLAAALKDHPEVVDWNGFTEAVFERQKINPPLLGNGIALPHARTSKVKEVVFAIARTAAPVLFGATPVRLIFLYGIPPHRVAEHLATTAALARRLRDPRTVEALMEASDEESFRRILL